MNAASGHSWTDGRSIVHALGIEPSGIVYRNLDVDGLYQAAVQRGQATVVATGALATRTDPYFGRAAKSSFYVNDPTYRHEGRALDALVNWGDPAQKRFDNLPTTPEVFARLKARVLKQLSVAGDLYVNDGISGRTGNSRMGIRVVSELAPSALFARNIFLRPSDAELAAFEADWTILHAPTVKAEPRDETHGDAFIITDLGTRTTIIGGTAYHGQIKKSIFCVQNFLLPLSGILTMHAGASEGTHGDAAIHAGLSGTGKTTLSNTGFPVADDQIVVDIDGPEDRVISNMEGGQYAKTEKLRRDKEPEVFDAIRYGTTSENIFYDEAGVPNYDDTSISANGRVGYPLEFVSSAKKSGTTRAPKNITFLTADGFGVLPPLALLTTEGAMYHFASGFTSKMPGTEEGVSEPKPTFSAFFGKPFMPLKPAFYTDLLAKLMTTHGTRVWLVNTGWLGPMKPGRGRVDIMVSKAIINAVRDGTVDLDEANFWYDPVFKIHVPKHVAGVDDHMLDPRHFWSDEAAYKTTANKLASIFVANAAKLTDLPEDVAAAGPAPID